MWNLVTAICGALKFVAALVLLAVFLAIPVPAAVSGSVAIQNAHVVTVSGSDLAKGTVLLRDGLIVDVGATVAIPPGTYVIDGTGLTVYPGFIDGLSTWGIPSAAPPAPGVRAGAAQAPAATSTTPPTPIRGAEDRPQTFSYERAADLVSPTDSRLESVRAAGFTSAATFPNRGIFMGQGALVDLAGTRGRDMVVAQPIGQEIALRAGGGGFGRSFPASLMGNIGYVRQVFLDLEQRKQAQQIYKTSSAAGRRPEYDRTLEGLEESPRILLPADERQQIERMLAFGRELNVPFVLYGLHEAYTKIDELKSAKAPLLISLKWPEKAKDGDPSEVENYRDLTMREQAPAVPDLLLKAGVKFAFFSDGVESAVDLKKALKKALDAGLPRGEAIRALTLSPAEIYGVSDRLGSIDKGKIANLTVMKGDAFDDATTVEYVFIDGEMFQPAKDLQKPPAKGPGSGDKNKPKATDVIAEDDDLARGENQ